MSRLTLSSPLPPPRSVSQRIKADQEIQRDFLFPGARTSLSRWKRVGRFRLIISPIIAERLPPRAFKSPSVSACSKISHRILNILRKTNHSERDAPARLNFKQTNKMRETPSRKVKTISRTVPKDDQTEKIHRNGKSKWGKTKSPRERDSNWSIARPSIAPITTYNVRFFLFFFSFFFLPQTIPLIVSLIKFVSLLSFVKDVKGIQTRKKYGFVEKNITLSLIYSWHVYVSSFIHEFSARPVLVCRRLAFSVYTIFPDISG